MFIIKIDLTNVLCYNRSSSKEGWVFTFKIIVILEEPFCFLGKEMKQMKKNLAKTALLLAASLVISSIPTTSFASETKATFENATSEALNSANSFAVFSKIYHKQNHMEGTFATAYLDTGTDACGITTKVEQYIDASENLIYIEDVNNIANLRFNGVSTDTLILPTGTTVESCNNGNGIMLTYNGNTTSYNNKQEVGADVITTVEESSYKIDFDAAFKALVKYSNHQATKNTEGTNTTVVVDPDTVDWNNRSINVTCGSGKNVINLTAAQLRDYKLNITGSGEYSVIINVTDCTDSGYFFDKEISVDGNSGGYGEYGGQVLFNFPSTYTGNLQFNKSNTGVILATSASVQCFSTHNGSVFANEVTNTGCEIHQNPFDEFVEEEETTTVEETTTEEETTTVEETTTEEETTTVEETTTEEESTTEEATTTKKTEEATTTKKVETETTTKKTEEATTTKQVETETTTKKTEEATTTKKAETETTTVASYETETTVKMAESETTTSAGTVTIVEDAKTADSSAEVTTKSTETDDDATGTLVIKIFDDDTNDAVPGAKVHVYDEDGNKIATATTDSDGTITLENVEEGKYTIQVVDVPEGYSVMNRTATVKVVAGKEKTQSLTVKTSTSGTDSKETTSNLGDYLAPKTGDEGIWYLILLMLLSAGFTTAMVARRKKEVAEEE